MSSKVLIVGAGPAGAASAFFLKHFDKENAREVLLIEKFDEEKYEVYHDICGEAASKACIKELPFKPDGILGKIKEMKHIFPKNVSIRDKVKGYLLHRPAFFKSMIEKFKELGGKFERNCLIDFEIGNGCVKAKLKDRVERFDYLIAADGPNSIIAKKLGIAGRRIPVLQYVVEKEPENEELLKFYVNQRYKGAYKWEFPHYEKDGSVNLKIGFPYYAKEKINAKIIKKQAKVIAFGGVDKVVHDKVLLVGEAAYQTNSYDFAGIRPAITSAKFAAKAIIENNPSIYQEYWEKCKKLHKIFNEACEMLKNMNDDEIAEYAKPFSRPFPLALLEILLRAKYWKYWKIYKADFYSLKYGR